MIENTKLHNDVISNANNPTTRTSKLPHAEIMIFHERKIVLSCRVPIRKRKQYSSKDDTSDYHRD